MLEIDENALWDRFRPDLSKSCGNCRFWQHKTDMDSDKLQSQGICRRRAPVSTVGNDEVAYTMATWPTTSEESDWCGEFELHPVWKYINELEANRVDVSPGDIRRLMEIAGRGS